MVGIAAIFGGLGTIAMQREHGDVVAVVGTAPDALAGVHAYLRVELASEAAVIAGAVAVLLGAIDLGRRVPGRAIARGLLGGGAAVILGAHVVALAAEHRFIVDGPMTVPDGGSYVLLGTHASALGAETIDVRSGPSRSGTAS